MSQPTLGEPWPTREDDVLGSSLDDLVALFVEGGKPLAAHRIGVEAEKFGVLKSTGAPIPYEGPQGVVALFERLVASHGWQPVREQPGGPVIALRRDGSGITLEPGAQLEWSGAPWATVHQVVAEFDRHRQELEPISAELGLRWLATGFHPLATQAELPWVPKQRYRIMREYFRAQGAAGLDMMRRTATAQLNVDYVDEADAMRKLRVALRLAPLVTALFANAPFKDGRPVQGWKSLRANVWLDVDPDRTGLLPEFMEPGRGFVDYVQWALDVPMFLFKRAGRIVANTGQSFRSFWRNGYQGHRATQADWEMHLNSLFPEARLKGFLELRSADSTPAPLVGALSALWTGLLVDPGGLDEAEQLTESFDGVELDRLRHQVGRLGLTAPWRGGSLQELAEQVIDVAGRGLRRRDRRDGLGRLEAVHLAPLVELCQAGHSPADVLLDGLSATMDRGAMRAEISRRVGW